MTDPSFPKTRDPYTWPFASDSIWNMPIQELRPNFKIVMSSLLQIGWTDGSNWSEYYWAALDRQWCSKDR